MVNTVWEISVVKRYQKGKKNGYSHNIIHSSAVVSFPDDFSLSGGKIRLVFHFGSGAPERWRIVLF